MDQLDNTTLTTRVLQHDADGNRTQDGRLTTHTLGRGLRTIQYDAASRLTQLTDTANTLVFSYYPLDRLIGTRGTASRAYGTRAPKPITLLRARGRAGERDAVYTHPERRNSPIFKLANRSSPWNHVAWKVGILSAYHLSVSLLLFRWWYGERNGIPRGSNVFAPD